MCKTYNPVGSLTTLKSHLYENNIHDFKSLKEVIDFRNSYPALRRQMLSRHEELIEQEKCSLDTELQELERAIETQKRQTEQRLIGEIDHLKQELNTLANYKSGNIFQKLTTAFKHGNYKRKMRRKEANFDTEVAISTSGLTDVYQSRSSRYHFITSQFNTAVEESARTALSEIDRKKTIIDNLNSFIYGALGEQRVVKMLETLPDEYSLINDFNVFFSPAIYNRQDNDYIKSIQVDHLLIAPSGVFLIETKNWSERSLENLSLRSPVEQIKRTNFALFKLLNNEMANSSLGLDRHHWGEKRIPIKNLIVLMNVKPKEEFQYVKILTLNELPGYINYFKPTISNMETRQITEFLLRINNQATSIPT